MEGSPASRCWESINSKQYSLFQNPVKGWKGSIQRCTSKYHWETGRLFVILIQLRWTSKSVLWLPNIKRVKESSVQGAKDSTFFFKHTMSGPKGLWVRWRRGRRESKTRSSFKNLYIKYNKLLVLRRLDLFTKRQKTRSAFKIFIYKV